MTTIDVERRIAEAANADVGGNVGSQRVDDLERELASTKAALAELRDDYRQLILSLESIAESSRDTNESLRRNTAAINRLKERAARHDAALREEAPAGWLMRVATRASVISDQIGGAFRDVSPEGHVRFTSGERPQFHKHIEVCQTSPVTFTITGWAFFESKTMESVEGLLLGANPLRQHERIMIESGKERADVRDGWQNVNALYSGFSATMPLRSFRPRAIELTFNTEDGYSATVTAKVERQPVDYKALAIAVWKASTPANIMLALKWICTGNLRRLWREIFGLLEHPAARRHPPVSLRHALDRIITPAPQPEPLPEPIDIIIPVYNGLKFLKPLFTSLRKNTSTPYRLIVIHDASPDAKVKPLLTRLLAKFDDVLLLENETNKGFVKSVNIGASHAEHDFVLLNTDTVVPPFWLERLMKPIADDRTIASTTPFSNAATVCSFPEICKDNKMLRGRTVEEIDAAFRRIDSDTPTLELPSGVGFCMGVNRDAWQAIGTLDEATFELGYGEENDWCLRAREADYRNIFVETLFVQHEHGGSFESEKKIRLMNDHLRIIKNRYPYYQKLVDDFINTDAPREFRTIAALLIAGMQTDPAPLLVIDHDLGGGATQYRDAMIAERAKAGQPVLLLHNLREPGPSAPELALSLYLDDSRFEVSIDTVDDLDELLDDHVTVGEIFYNNLVSHRAPLEMVPFMMRLKERMSARLTVAMHDFYPVCPSYTLLNDNGAFCGVPDLETCRACLHRNPHAANPANDTIDQWRETWGGLLGVADDIVCFSEDSKTHLLRAYPEHAASIRVRPHTLQTHFSRKPKFGSGKHLSIGVVGGVSYQKGAHVVAELAAYLAETDPDAHITVIGTLNDAPSTLTNLTVTGRYVPAKLPDLLEAHAINVCLIPSIWPETFSYVTAELMALDAPIVAFDIGAPAERLVDYPRARLLPIAQHDQPEAVVTALTDLVQARPSG